MGRTLLRLAASEDAFDVVAAVSRSAQTPSSDGRWFIPAQGSEIPDFDVAVDFSLPGSMAFLLDLCRARRAALVSGTTGISPDEQTALDAAASDIAILWAPNFSLGVAVLGALVQRAAAALPAWDVDIVELHHSGKRDAPSGTALKLADAVAAGSGRPARFHSLRAGDAVGEHSVQLSGRGERLELIHRATDRDVFAQGALFAARWLAHQPAGRYRLEDALAPALGNG